MVFYLDLYCWACQFECLWYRVLRCAYALLILKRQSQQLSSALSSACYIKVIFANSVDPDQTAPLAYICENRFEKFARIFSRRHKQTTFSDAGFLGVLRVNYEYGMNSEYFGQLWYIGCTILVAIFQHGNVNNKSLYLPSLNRFIRIENHINPKNSFIISQEFFFIRTNSNGDVVNVLVCLSICLSVCEAISS